MRENMDMQTPLFRKTGDERKKAKIELKIVKSEYQKEYLQKIVRIYHSYKQSSHYSGRMINYLIYDQFGDCLGVIGFGSSFFCTTARDDAIGWSESARWQNLQNISNNWRFTIKPNRYKNIATSVLSLATKYIKEDWQKKYGNKLYMLDTYVQPPRSGNIYKANGWEYVGNTVGADFSGRGYEGNLTDSLARCRNLDKGKVKRKMVFIKPLHRHWRKRLQFWEDKELKKFYELNKLLVSELEVDKEMQRYDGLVSRHGALKMILLRKGIKIRT